MSDPEGGEGPDRLRDVAGRHALQEPPLHDLLREQRHQPPIPELELGVGPGAIGHLLRVEAREDVVL